jgi:alpha,alpha-trehalase
VFPPLTKPKYYSHDTFSRLGAVPEDISNNYTILSHVFDEGNKTLNEYPGILTSSLHNTTLQWDLPNGWVGI